MSDTAWREYQIGRFEWHCMTHIFEPAKVLADAFRDNVPPLHNSGFLILCGVVPYFEGLGQHILGDDKDNEAFKVGFRDVYEATLKTETDTVAERVKQKVRNGLFHDAVVRGRTELSRHFTVAIRLTPERLELNPYLLVNDLEAHLGCYLARLRACDPDCASMRMMFDKRRRKFEAAYEGLPPVTDDQTMTTPGPNDPAYHYAPYDEHGGLRKA